jgi:hypothetical protein
LQELVSLALLLEGIWRGSGDKKLISTTNSLLQGFFMKSVVYLFALLTFSTIIACSDDANGTSGFPTLIPHQNKIDIPIGANQSHYYKIVVTEAGTYWISLSDLGSNMLWKLYNHTTDSIEDYTDFFDYCNDWNNTYSEHKTVTLNIGTYVVQVQEAGNIDSSYSLKYW